MTRVQRFFERLRLDEEDHLSPEWLAQQVQQERVEFHGVSWQWPIRPLVAVPAARPDRVARFKRRMTR